MMRSLLIAGLMLWTRCGSERLREPMPDARTRAYRACERDEQCIHTNNGCCDCMNGGVDIAVRREKLDAFRAQFSCESTGCTEMAGSCGDGRVTCERGLCVYRALAR